MKIHNRNDKYLFVFFRVQNSKRKSPYQCPPDFTIEDSPRLGKFDSPLNR